MDYASWKAEELLKGFKVDYDSSLLNDLANAGFLAQSTYMWLNDVLNGYRDDKGKEEISVQSFPKFRTAEDVELWHKNGVITREFADVFESKYGL